MGPTLRRELTVWSATAIVVSNMIGTGIFTSTGFQAGDLGRTPLILSVWLVGAVVALAGCLSYAELGINFPRSGGEYVYLREAWGPLYGFLGGWVSFFAGFAAPIAAAALAFSQYVGHLLPAPAVEAIGVTEYGWFHLDARRGLAVAVIAFFALVNVRGIGVAAKFQNLLTGLKLAVLATFLILAFTVGHGSAANLSLAAVRTSQHTLSAQFAVSLIFVMFAYSGWNAATYVAEEMKTPERTLPVVLVAGTLTVAVFYLLLNVAFIYAVPLESLKGVVDVGGEASRALFGGRGGNLFSAMMAAGLLSCISAMVIVGPRVYYAMAQDGCFFRGAAQVHSRWNTPVQAILWQAVAAIVMVLTGAFESLVYYIGFALTLFAALAVLGLMRMRRRPEWKRLPAVSWAYPLVPLTFILASIWILAYTLALRPTESAFGLLTVLGGVLLYRFSFRKVSLRSASASLAHGPQSLEQEVQQPRIG